MANAGIVSSGSVTMENCKKSLVDGTAFIDIFPELVLNSELDSWAGDDPVSWSVVNEDANNTISEHVDGARLVSDNTAVLEMKQTMTTVANASHVLEVPISNYVERDVRLWISDGVLSGNNMGWTANGVYTYYFTAVDTS